MDETRDNYVSGRSQTSKEHLLCGPMDGSVGGKVLEMMAGPAVPRLLGPHDGPAVPCLLGSHTIQ